MSILNGIGEGSLNELLARRLNTPGGAVAPGVAPELFPTLVLESDRPEWGYSKGEQYGSVARSISAVSGEYSYLWLSNPFPPNLCTILEIEVTSSGTTTVGAGVYPGFAASAIGNGFNRDTRFGATNQTVFEAGTGALAPTVQRVFTRMTAANKFLQPIILKPDNNNGLIIYNTAVNTSLVVNVHYRMRGAQPGELR